VEQNHEQTLDGQDKNIRLILTVLQAFPTYYNFWTNLNFEVGLSRLTFFSLLLLKKCGICLRKQIRYSEGTFFPFHNYEKLIYFKYHISSSLIGVKKYRTLITPPVKSCMHSD